MRNIRRRRAIALFISLGVCMVALAVTLQFGWIILNWRRLVPLVLGIPFFALLIAGVILNTIFLVREVRRNEHHDSFLNAVTHELKTPVASIRLYLETLQRRNLPEAQRQEFYGIMLADSERLLATIEQVLKAGEVGQRAKKNQVRVEVDLLTLVKECIQITLQRYHLEPDRITLQPVDHQTLLAVSGDRQDLHSAILNVLDNAVKYSPEQVAVRVSISLENDAWILIRVTDDGIGVPAAHLKGIFKRFYRVPNMSLLKVKGTGLGLFLVRSIVRQHGGDARAESAGEGKGTTIILQLPRLLTPATESQTALLDRSESLTRVP
ncbi:sensor histidine kinase [Acidisarcina polymorpha]|uniref:histidine kinase n=1 Tax=Acidisarcina polymorpha TaxID=2211140 RepID=A0A2Z5G6X1_9BACT|nr:HAMP domain-containing sensor histidine kinase [Acidisarcina polymorpha]AXC14739.1 sensor histidine kinase [Acidisarcina polymorpha]